MPWVSWSPVCVDPSCSLKNSWFTAATFLKRFSTPFFVPSHLQVAFVFGKKAYKALCAFAVLAWAALKQLRDLIEEKRKAYAPLQGGTSSASDVSSAAPSLPAAPPAAAMPDAAWALHTTDVMEAESERSAIEDESPVHFVHFLL